MKMTTAYEMAQCYRVYHPNFRGRLGEDKELSKIFHETDAYESREIPVGSELHESLLGILVELKIAQDHLPPPCRTQSG